MFTLIATGFSLAIGYALLQLAALAALTALSLAGKICYTLLNLVLPGQPKPEPTDAD